MRNTGTLTVTTPTDQEIVLTRVFAAPRALVFDALTKPELLTRWFGPRGWSLVICEVDLRVGGAWRFLLRGPDGHQMGMRGVYRAIERPDRLVHTEVFDDYQESGEATVTTHLVERDGQTTLIGTVRYPSRAVRDAVVASGMEHGAAESYDRLADVLATVAAPGIAGGGAMTTRVDDLTARFVAVNDELSALVAGCTDDQWRRPVANDDRSVGVVAHHVAVIHPAFARMIDRLANGETYSPRSSMEQVHASNADHARDQAAVGKPAVLAALRANGADLATALRGLDDDQLDRLAGIFGGQELSVARVVELVVIGHPAEHLASLRATLAE